MRFRCGSVAISADIESMFHRIRVPLKDRDALRFLWKPDIALPETVSKPPDVYQMCVHIFGAKCSPACANYCLKRLAVDKTILHSFYVDDMLRSLNSVGEAVSLALEMIRLCDKGGMKLTKWSSNCPEVLDAISTQPGITTLINLDLDGSSITRALGIACDMRNDKFIFSTDKVQKPLTKRGILSVICSIFDPLGFVAPYVIRAKRVCAGMKI
jgi:hypothetical protein